MKLIDILVEELPKRGGWPEGANFIAQDEGRATWSFINEPAKDEDDEWMENSETSYHKLLGHLPEASDYDTTIITREQYEAALAAKNEGWIEWGGGECPLPRGALVDVRYRDGKQLNALSANYGTLNPRDASFVFWRNCGCEKDIIAYRLHQPQEVEQAEADDEDDLNECIGQDAAPVWNGEGLPPVGCECEYLDSNNEWYPVTIKYASKQIVVICGMTNILGDKQETEIAKDIQLDKPQFRPIRTEEDKKRDAAIKELTSVICGEIPDTGMATAAMYAARVYDAGYRK